MSNTTDNLTVVETHSLDEIVAHTFRAFVSGLINTEKITIDNTFNRIRVVYSTSTQPSQLEFTRIQVTIHKQSKEAWIGDLLVDPDRRFTGIGTRLVEAAESLALAMDVAIVNVWPLHQSSGFWRKMGYRPHKSMSRALSKAV